MNKQGNTGSLSGAMIMIAVLANAIVLSKGMTADAYWYRGLFLTLPVLLLFLYQAYQDKQHKQNRLFIKRRIGSLRKRSKTSRKYYTSLKKASSE